MIDRSILVIFSVTPSWRRCLLLILFCQTLHYSVIAEQTLSDTSSLKFTGYIETYYSFDMSNPEDHQRPSFLYSYNRHNEFNLNLGLIKADYQKSGIRATLGLMTGTYPSANLASEPVALRNMYQSSIGVKLSDNQNLWLDAGIFPSHIGFESAIGADCMNLTRSIMADNSPYYESGAKITYTTPGGNWLFSGLLLNGWQRITRIHGNNTPAFGHQITFSPNGRITINSSSFIGSDTPDVERSWRFFHNFYAIFRLNQTLDVIIGFDNGSQQKSKHSGEYYQWYSPVLIARYTINDKMRLAIRGEYFDDHDGVIIDPANQRGFECFGYSMNFDYVIRPELLARIEGRIFHNDETIFKWQDAPSAINSAVTASLCIRLN